VEGTFKSKPKADLSRYPAMQCTTRKGLTWVEGKTGSPAWKG
jgi:hypothetical protein